jgi:hypothetical protein
MAFKIPLVLHPMDSQVNNPDINGAITAASIDGGSDPVGLLFDSTGTDGGLWSLTKGSYNTLVANLVFQKTDIGQVSGDFDINIDIKKIPPLTNKSTLVYDTVNTTVNINIPSGATIQTFEASVTLSNVDGIVAGDYFYYRLSMLNKNGWAGKMLLIDHTLDGNLI